MPKKWSIIKPENAFLFIALIYGIGFMFVIPPFQVPDEWEHSFKAYGLSDGKILPQNNGTDAGYYVPQTLQATVDKVHYAWWNCLYNGKKIDLQDLMNTNYNRSGEKFRSISTIAVVTYTPIPYLTTILSIKIGEYFKLSPLVIMYLGRLANLLLWTFLTYLAIRITPVHKWTLLVLALLPITLFEAASVSADSLTIGLSFLLISLLLKFSLDSNKKKIDKKDITLLIVVVLLISLTKQIYLFLILLMFVIPFHKFGGYRKTMGYFSIIFFPAIIISLYWAFMVKGLYNPMDPHISIQGQFMYVFNHPFNFIRIMLDSILKYLSNYPVIAIGNWGCIDHPLPSWIYIIYISTLFLVPFIDKNSINLDLRHRLVILSTFIICLTLIYLTTYATWVSVGRQIIHGVQGRYLIPIFPLLLLLFYNKKIKINLNNDSGLIIIFLIIFYLTITIYILSNRYFNI